jgi:peptidoglycan/xylan/chitin deacetylase (PgdA/CDA1 family)
VTLNEPVAAYEPDRSLAGVLRRRLVRLTARRPVQPRLARPMLTVTFDDIPESAASAGASVLESRGVRGTFFVAAGLAGRDGPMGRYAGGAAVRALADAGHEIGCHTYSHLDCGRAGPDDALADVAKNADAFAAWGIVPPTSFAYPYGDLSGPTKTVLGDRFASLRAVHRGLVWGGADLNQLPAVGLEGADAEARSDFWLREAKTHSAWLIVFTHDVSIDPSRWGCTPSVLEGLLDAARANEFDVVTMAEGTRRVTA